MGWHYVVRFKWDVDGMMGVGCYLTCASLNDVVPCACARRLTQFVRQLGRDALALEV